LGLGGETAGGGNLSLVAFFALTKMGASFCISSSGATEDSPLLAESLSDIVGLYTLARVKLWMWERVEVQSGAWDARQRNEFRGGARHVQGSCDESPMSWLTCDEVWQKGLAFTMYAVCVLPPRGCLRPTGSLLLPASRLLMFFDARWPLNRRNAVPRLAAIPSGSPTPWMLCLAMQIVRPILMVRWLSS